MSEGVKIYSIVGIEFIPYEMDRTVEWTWTNELGVIRRGYIRFAKYARNGNVDVHICGYRDETGSDSECVADLSAACSLVFPCWVLRFGGQVLLVRKSYVGDAGDCVAV